jgi:hypothetical protein
MSAFWDAIEKASDTITKVGTAADKISQASKVLLAKKPAPTAQTIGAPSSGTGAGNSNGLLLLAGAALLLLKK